MQSKEQPGNGFGPEEQLDAALSVTPGRGRRRRLLLAGSLLLMVPALRQWTPLGDYLHPGHLQFLGESLKQHPYAPALVIGAFWLGGMLLLPLTLLVLTVALLFQPIPAVVYAMAGSLGCAITGYGIGRLLGLDTAHRLSGGRLERMRGWLQGQGLFSVMLLRNVPLAPFTITNVIAGAAPIRLPAFLGGTLFGLAPGIITLALVGSTLGEVLAAPGQRNVAMLVLILTVAVGMSWMVRRRLSAG